MPVPEISDTIKLSDAYAGDANAGNGGDGVNYGDVYISPVAFVANKQDVEGAYTKLNNGDHVWQYGEWEADDGGDGGYLSAATGIGPASNLGSGGAGGASNSNGDVGSSSGGNIATVSAPTTATQNTSFLADQSSTILAGVGGIGGSGNTAEGGDISSAVVHSETATTALSNIDNAFGIIDLSDVGA